VSENVSPAELFALLPPEQLAALMKQTSDRELEAIEHDWWQKGGNRYSKLTVEAARTPAFGPNLGRGA
jgi:hypothetical protein